MPTSTDLTKEELRTIRETLAPLLVPPPRPLTAEQLVRVGEVLSRVDHVIDVARPVEEPGEMVLEWRIPREWTAVKSGKGLRKWVLGRIKNDLSDALRKLLPQWPNADLCFAQRRRWVQVRRFSDKKPDRPHCPDCLGARQAIDCLKDAGIIVDDSPTWTVDDSDWIQCKRGETHVVVRVFDITTEGRHRPEPECLPPSKPAKKRGPMVQAIVSAAGARAKRKRKR